MAQHTQAATEDYDGSPNHRVPKEPLRRSVRNRLAQGLAISLTNTHQSQLDSESEGTLVYESERVRASLMT